MKDKWSKRNLLLFFIGMIALCQLIQIFNYIGIFIQTIIKILIPFIVGFLLSCFLLPFVNKLNHILKMKYKYVFKNTLLISILIVYFVFLFSLSSVLFLIIPIVFQQIIEFISNIEMLYVHFLNVCSNAITNDGLLKMLLFCLEHLKIFIDIDSKRYVDTAFIIANGVYSFLIGIILCPYMLYEHSKILNLVRQLLKFFIADNVLEMINKYFLQSYHIFTCFIIGKFVDSLIIGVICFLFLLIMKIRYAIVFAIIMCMVNMIPYIGPIVGSIIVICLTLISESSLNFITVSIFLIVLAQIDSLFLEPLIVGELVGLRPFWILVSITIFGGLWGIIGMIIGVPLMAIFKVVIQDIIINKSDVS